ncbi:AAA ATPase-like domain-containing protein [Desulfonema limicola]|uniref:AAA ATPase-like domain-containing protein n=1 Tax=Desulfonema limicola TaxID=45656 RepID=A0A975GG07_9BACT|nr:AAA family ATPase [Desulfonema limicola]QTA79783.1 AAA ATPase-like domain-containing protein [Desulfonema limicola]
MTTKKLPIGLSDFKELIENDYYYIDKTKYIKDIINSSSKILLLPRPRRFGKTLNLSMLKYFFDKSLENHKELFKGLEIEKHEEFELYQGKYPVIFMTFKDVKHSQWEACFSSIKTAVKKEYSRHRYLLETDTLYPEDKIYFQNILSSELKETGCDQALYNLSEYLHRHYNEKVMILIDEYDTPIHAAYTSGYYNKLIEFIRNFLSAGLKDNTYLFKGVLTGILRVAKESVFSGLNNLGVYTLLDKEFNTFFGFTEPEAAELLKDYDLSNRYNDVSAWYKGYNFGGEVIYNPWSILQFTHRKPKIPSPYWVNTADTGMIDSLATKGGREVKEEIGYLLEGKSVAKPVYESIVLYDLEKRDDLLWSFLLFSGYLKTAGEKGQKNTYQLAIPNREVRYIYEEMIIRWFGEKIESSRIETLLNSLIKGNIDDFEYLLADIVEKVLSFHDTGGTEPEKFYHAFILGLLVWLEDRYEVKSNRESGLGRYDAALIPKDRTKIGIIMEFKKVNERKNETPEQTLKKAMEQIENKKYAAELEAAGIKDIIKIAVAFKGKELWLEHSLLK